MNDGGKRGDRFPHTPSQPNGTRSSKRGKERKSRIVHKVLGNEYPQRALWSHHVVHGVIEVGR